MSPADDAPAPGAAGDGRHGPLAEMLLVALAPVGAVVVALSVVPSAHAVAAAVTTTVMLAAGAMAVASSLRAPGRTRVCLPRTSACVTA